MSEIISVPIETYVMKVRAIMCSTVSPIMIRQTEVEQTTIRIIHINPETPSSAGNINRAVEIISSQKPTILCVTQYPPSVIITNIQSFIIINAQSVFHRMKFPWKQGVSFLIHDILAHTYTVISIAICSLII